MKIQASSMKREDGVVLLGFFQREKKIGDSYLTSFFPPSTLSPFQQPFPHESLLIDRRELKLSSAEKKAAKKGYEEEKRASVPYTRPSYAHYYPASDQSLTNIPAFSQRNWSVT